MGQLSNERNPKRASESRRNSKPVSKSAISASTYPGSIATCCYTILLRLATLSMSQSATQCFFVITFSSHLEYQSFPIQFTKLFNYDFIRDYVMELKVYWKEDMNIGTLTKQPKAKHEGRQNKTKDVSHAFRGRPSLAYWCLPLLSLSDTLYFYPGVICGSPTRAERHSVACLL